MLRSDNEKEYSINFRVSFFKKKGIIHHSFCTQTLKQNRVAKRKNRHLLEVNRSLMFTTNVPKYLWGKAILTDTYLINKMPSRVLNFESPLTVFKNSFHMSLILSDVPLKVWLCGICSCASSYS